MANELRQTDADRVRELLDQAGVSQRGAARHLRIDERTMRRYCSGEMDVPQVVMMALGHLAANPPAR